MGLGQKQKERLDQRLSELRAKLSSDNVTADTLVGDTPLSVRALNGSANAGVLYDAPVRSLATLRRSTVARGKNLGAVSLAELDALIAHCGLAWADDSLLARTHEALDDLSRLAAKRELSEELFRAMRRVRKMARAWGL